MADDGLLGRISPKLARYLRGPGLDRRDRDRAEDVLAGVSAEEILADPAGVFRRACAELERRQAANARKAGR